MNSNNKILITGLALFSMVFGAGNLILPPFLGFKAGADWIWVVLGFFLTAVVVPVLAIATHAKLQGTLADFGAKISPKFGLVYSVIMYLIAVALPTPRTAAVTHEIGIAPFFDSPAILTSTIYFTLVLIFAWNRSRILDTLGKYLTPLIIVILLAIIAVAIFVPEIGSMTQSYNHPISKGLFEGYQTYDAIGGAVAGGVLIVSLKLKFPNLDFKAYRSLIFKSGLLAGGGLLLIYAGLIYAGAAYQDQFTSDANNVEVLVELAQETLGVLGHSALAVLVSLACFSTAVAIVTGTSDFVTSLIGGSDRVFKLTAIVASLLGLLMGQLNVSIILDIGLPAIYLIYPVTICLILLNLSPERFASKKVFISVVSVVVLFSVVDIFKYFLGDGFSAQVDAYIPFSEQYLGWVLPGLIAFVSANLSQKKTA